MKLIIDVKISTNTLGDENSPADNHRYASAVLGALQDEYPGADVVVKLISNTDSNQYLVGDDPTGEIAENVSSIVNDIWNDANY